MSTRRARIKAPAALTVRKKNAPAIASTEIQTHNNLPNEIKSPYSHFKSPRVSNVNASGNASPKNKRESPNVKLSHGTRSPIVSHKTSAHTVFAVPLELGHQELSVVKTPKSNNAAEISTVNKSVSNIFGASTITDSPKESPLHNNFTSGAITNNINNVEDNVTCANPFNTNCLMQSPIPNITLEGNSKNVENSIAANLKNNFVGDLKTNSVGILCNKGESQNYVISKDVSQPIIEVPDEQRDIQFDYNPPSIVESLTEETVMDGIVPLQPASNAPKPIDVLKNEIISENVQVLFDPIVPLPSPSKIRTKLRPAPRLNPMRRNSVQGSASESEDENRRNIVNSISTPVPSRLRTDSHTSHSTLQSTVNREVQRIRNDSISSGLSQMTPLPTNSSILKERTTTKTKRRETNRRPCMSRHRREKVQRETLTMYDLIYYNPTTNPIIPDQDEILAKEANAKDEIERNNEPTVEIDDAPTDVEEAAPVPQIMLDGEGEIILDEQSLAIEQTVNRKLLSGVVREGAWSKSGGKYTRGPRTADWSDAETVRFYRALATIGTDFSLMAPLFPGRSRKDVKLKFKKEERNNLDLVDKALRSCSTWNVSTLQEEFIEERLEAKRLAELEREQFEKKKMAERNRLKDGRKLRVRKSLGGKALETTMRPGIHDDDIVTADSLVESTIIRNKRNRKNTKSNNSTKPTRTLTLIEKKRKLETKIISTEIPSVSNTPSAVTPQNPMAAMPANIEMGSLVVLSVSDPNSPAKKMLQTYISHGAGKLTPVALPPALLSSVMNYMKKGTPKSNSTLSSPHILSPPSVSSQESRVGTPSVIQVNPNSVDRRRTSSYSIMQL